MNSCIDSNGSHIDNSSQENQSSTNQRGNSKRRSSSSRSKSDGPQEKLNYCYDVCRNNDSQSCVSNCIKSYGQ